MKKQIFKRAPFRRLTPLSRILLLIACLIVIAMLARGWIRHSALAWYGTQITGSSVDKAFDDSFSDFNRQLEATGLTLTSVHKVNLPCSATSYHHFRVSVQCMKSNVVYANPVIPDKAIANWPNLYRTLTSHMTGGKSHVAPQSNVLPSTLFVYQPKPTGFPENDVRLEGHEGKVTCSIDMIGDAPHVTTSLSIPVNHSAGLLMTKHCERDINFFGGWDCDSRDHNYCRPDNS